MKVLKVTFKNSGRLRLKDRLAADHGRSKIFDRRRLSEVVPPVPDDLGRRATPLMRFCALIL